LLYTADMKCVSRTALLAAIQIFANIAMASGQLISQQNLGTYTVPQLSSVKICGKKNIDEITLHAKADGQNCTGQIKIDTVSLGYSGGFKQQFDFPQGSELTTASFRLLPGTKCLHGFSAKLKVTGETNNACKHQVQISALTR